jgi:hypothetical protein
MLEVGPQAMPRYPGWVRRRTVEWRTKGQRPRKGAEFVSLTPYSCITVQSAEAEPGKEAYLHIPGASLDPRTTITVWGFDTRGVHFTNHFEFVLIPAGDTDDTYYLANRRSGLVLQVDQKPSPQDWGFIQAVAGQGTPDDPTDDQNAHMAAQFVFEPVEGASGDVYRIANQLTGTYLAIPAGQRSNGTPLVAAPAMGGAMRVDNTFRVTQVADLMAVVPKPVTKAGPRIPHPKTLESDLPDCTDPLLRDIDVIPYLMVNDPVMPRHRQVEASPYYTLGLKQMWRRVFDRQLDGIVERETVETTETGLTSIDARSVASTFSWSVSAQASASYKSFGFRASLSVSSKLAGETSKTASSSEEHRQEHQFTETILYPATGEPYRLIKWRPVDRYELRRKDGLLVDSWDAVRANEEIIDVIPRKATPKPRQMAPTEADRIARSKERKELAAVR